MHTLKQKQPALKLTLQWMPGHEGIEGNKKANKEVKQAAQGSSSPASNLPHLLRQSLPISASSLHRNFKHHPSMHATARW